MAPHHPLALICKYLLPPAKYPPTKLCVILEIHAKYCLCLTELTDTMENFLTLLRCGRSSTAASFPTGI